MHEYCSDIVFVELEDGKRKVSVLEQVIRYGRLWEVEELVRMEGRVVKEFGIQTLIWAICNVHN